MYLSAAITELGSIISFMRNHHLQLCYLVMAYCLWLEALETGQRVHFG